MLATFFSNVARDITNSINSAFNTTNTTALLSSAQNLPETIIKKAIESSSLPTAPPKPLTEQTIKAIQTTTKDLLEQTETGKKILQQSNSQINQIQTQFKKIHEQKLELFRRINNSWKTTTTNAIVLYKALATRVKNPHIIVNDAQQVVEKADNFTKKAFTKLTGIESGVCYRPPANATAWDACIEPPLDCIFHAVSPLRDTSCCTYPTQCGPAISKNKDYLIELAKNTALSWTHTLGRKGLSATFEVYPFLNTTYLPPQNQTDSTSWSSAAGLIATSLAGYFGLAMAGIQQKQITRSLPFGAAIGAGAGALWGTNPFYGAIKGGVSSIVVDSVLYYPLEGFIQEAQKNQNLQRAGNALPLALTVGTALSIFAMESYLPFSPWDVIGSASFLALFPVTTLYAISSWSRSLTHNTLPLVTAPVIAYASLVTAETYLEMTSSYCPGGIYGASATLFATTMGLLALQYRRIFARV